MIAIDVIKERYGTEMAFVVLTCRLYFDTCTKEELIVFCRDNKLNMLVAYKIIAAHQIRPIIYHALMDNDIHINDELMQKLKRDIMLIATGNQQKVKQTIEICNAFTKAGIIAYPYKGWLMSRMLYDNLVSREVSDIDLLIYPKDFFKAKELLENMCYMPRYDTDRKHFYQQMLKTDSEYKCAKQNHNQLHKVELHWVPTHTMLDVPLDNDFFFRNGTVENISGNAVNVLEQDDHLLLMLIHHGVNDIWRSLRHVADWGRVLSKKDANLDWPKINEQIKDSHLVNTVAAGTSLSYTILGVKNENTYSDFKRKDQLASALLTFPMQSKGKTSFYNFSTQLLLKDSFRYKVRLVRNYLLTAVRPSKSDVRFFYLPRPFYFLYFIIKPFRLAVSAIQPKKSV